MSNKHRLREIYAILLEAGMKQRLCAGCQREMRPPKDMAGPNSSTKKIMRSVHGTVFYVYA